MYIDPAGLSAGGITVAIYDWLDRGRKDWSPPKPNKGKDRVAEAADFEKAAKALAPENAIPLGGYHALLDAINVLSALRAEGKHISTLYLLDHNDWIWMPDLSRSGASN